MLRPDLVDDGVRVGHGQRRLMVYYFSVQSATSMWKWWRKSFPKKGYGVSAAIYIQ